MYGGFSGLSQSEILRRYMALEKTGDGLKRDERTFYKEVWPSLEDLRKREKTIQTFERMQYGKEIPVWQLK